MPTDIIHTPASRARWYSPTRRYRFLLLLIILLGSLAMAREVSDLSLASQLFRDGQHADAEALISELRKAPSPHFEVIFLSGMLHMEAARYDQAADEFRLLVNKDPALIRPRLELARALQLSRDFQGARYHYEQVLAAPLPEQVVYNIYQQLLAMRARQPAFLVSTELVSDSNPLLNTGSRTIEIDGQPYQLNDQARAEAATGLTLSGQMHVPLPANPSWYLSGYGEMNHFPDSHLSHHYAQLSLGKRIERARHGARLELGRHYSQRAGQSLFEGFTLRTSAHWRWSQAVTVTGDASVQEMSYTRLRFLDGYFSQLGSSLVMSPTPHQRWILRVGLTRYEAQEAAYSYTQPGLSLRLIREWPGGWVTGIQGQALSARFDAPDLFFGDLRRDREFRLDIDLLNRHLQIFSLTPRLLFGYAQRSSTLPLYDFQRRYLRLGLTRDY